jgi:hypothetical protein
VPIKKRKSDFSESNAAAASVAMLPVGRHQESIQSYDSLQYLAPGILQHGGSGTSMRKSTTTTQQYSRHSTRNHEIMMGDEVQQILDPSDLNTPSVIYDFPNDTPHSSPDNDLKSHLLEQMKDIDPADEATENNDPENGHELSSAIANDLNERVGKTEEESLSVVYDQPSTFEDIGQSPQSQPHENHRRVTEWQRIHDSSSWSQRVAKVALNTFLDLDKRFRWSQQSLRQAFSYWTVVTLQSRADSLSSMLDDSKQSNIFLEQR